MFKIFASLFWKSGIFSMQRSQIKNLVIKHGTPSFSFGQEARIEPHIIPYQRRVYLLYYCWRFLFLVLPDFLHKMELCQKMMFRYKHRFSLWDKYLFDGFNQLQWALAQVCSAMKKEHNKYKHQDPGSAQTALKHFGGTKDVWRHPQLTNELFPPYVEI